MEDVNLRDRTFQEISYGLITCSTQYKTNPVNSPTAMSQIILLCIVTDKKLY
jgi:hypothetical protein